MAVLLGSRTSNRWNRARLQLLTLQELDVIVDALSGRIAVALLFLPPPHQTHVCSAPGTAV